MCIPLIENTQAITDNTKNKKNNPFKTKWMGEVGSGSLGPLFTCWSFSYAMARKEWEALCTLRVFGLLDVASLST
jgi:hypothetical protein